MRVNNVYTHKKIVVKSGNDIISEFKKEHLAPAEMEKIVLSKSKLDGIKEDLIISVEDDK